MTYSEKLKDPRWQKKRLEILQRDFFECQFCLANDTELHVHHLYYLHGLEPWEYGNNYLITLCKDCHEKWHSSFGNEMVLSMLETIIKLKEAYKNG